jgi:hypothetical protein
MAPDADADADAGARADADADADVPGAPAECVAVGFPPAHAASSIAPVARITFVADRRPATRRLMAERYTRSPRPEMREGRAIARTAFRRVGSRQGARRQSPGLKLIG